MWFPTSYPSKLGFCHRAKLTSKQYLVHLSGDTSGSASGSTPQGHLSGTPQDYLRGIPTVIAQVFPQASVPCRVLSVFPYMSCCKRCFLRRLELTLTVLLQLFEPVENRLCSNSANSVVWLQAQSTTGFAPICVSACGVQHHYTAAMRTRQENVVFVSA